jgi:glutaconyl-CoA/methylmalonyl-CoA decarboxylase subunit gamma
MSKKLVVKVNGNPYEVEIGDLSKSPVAVSVNGKSYKVEFEENTAPVAEPAKKAEPVPVAAAPAAAGTNALTAPMPGKIMDISVKPGDKLTAGQPVCALEAMKMKNIIRSPRAGTVASVEVTDGQKVAFGTVIIRYA